MTSERDSAHFRTLERLGAMPRPARGIAGGDRERPMFQPVKTPRDPRDPTPRNT
jgi:hypothetical protein